MSAAGSADQLGLTQKVTLMWVAVGLFPTGLMIGLAWFLQGSASSPPVPPPFLLGLFYLLTASEWVATFIIEFTIRQPLRQYLPSPQALEQREPPSPTPLSAVEPIAIRLTVVLAALGLSIAVYGLVLALLGVSFNSTVPLYLIAGAHLVFFRLRVRRLLNAVFAPPGLPPSID